MTRSTASPAVYQAFLQQDASSAGVPVPTRDDMARKFSYRVDEARHVLEPGQPAVEVAGLRLRVERSGDTVVMVIQNRVESDLAYAVTSSPSGGASSCNSTRPLPFNAVAIAKGATETRTECTWRSGMAIIVTRVETLEIPPLSTWYLSQVPPKLVGVEDRIARGHHGVDTGERCGAVLSQVVRTGMDRGDIGWRDLADFYARHRCQTYHFPASYRAVKSDGERAIPAVDAAD